MASKEKKSLRVFRVYRKMRYFTKMHQKISALPRAHSGINGKG